MSEPGLSWEASRSAGPALEGKKRSWKTLNYLRAAQTCPEQSTLLWQEWFTWLEFILVGVFSVFVCLVGFGFLCGFFSCCYWFWGFGFFFLQKTEANLSFWGASMNRSSGRFRCWTFFPGEISGLESLLFCNSLIGSQCWSEFWGCPTVLE